MPSELAQRSQLQAIQRGLALTPESAAEVATELQSVTCRGGEWLFRQGDPGDGLYLLVRGRLQVWIDAPESGAGPRLVAEVAPGETVGEIGMLSGGLRSAGIRAMRDSLLLRMDTAAFDRLAARRPELTRHLAGGIATRLRDRTAGAAPARRPFSTVTLLPLDDSRLVHGLVERLEKALGARGSVRVLNSASIAAQGGLPLPERPGAAVAPETVDWLADQEDQHRFVVYVADPGPTPWTDVALRHADLVLLVADATGSPARRHWEAELLDAQKGPVARTALVLCHPGSPTTLTGTARWLADRRLDFHLHLRGGMPRDFERLVRVIDGSALGLVLGGGAARGFAHLGVYKALVEAGVPIDWLGGSSIGSVMGAQLALDLPPDECIRRGRLAFVEGKPFGDVTLPVVSLLRGARMERLIGEYLGGEIEDLPLPFFCVSSNLGSGLSRLHDRGSLPLALRASVSLPGIFPPAVVDGQLAIDGGILDNLPVDHMRSRPVGRVVAVDVTARQTYDVDYASVPSPWTVLAGRYLPFRRRYRVPGFMSVLLKAAEVGTMAAAREAGRRADLLIRPDVSRFSLTNVKAYEAIVAAGEASGREAAAALQAK